MNTPVSFEIAKLLKEKGFDGTAQKAYMVRNEFHKLDSYKGILVDAPLHCDVSAPTIAEVVMWLYDKHGIWISVKQIQQKDTFTWEIVQSNEEKWHSIDWSGEEINSPKAAEYVCIEKSNMENDYTIQKRHYLCINSTRHA